MALTLETGSVVAGADTYVALATYQAYLTSRGRTAGATDAADEVNLRLAFDAINRNWHYIGFKVDEDDQVGAWPRYIPTGRFDYVTAPDSIPQDIQDAQCELAYLIQGGLDVFETITGTVKRKMVKAGPVESETEYQGGLGRPRIVAVEGLLSRYLAVGPGQVRVYRG